MKTWFIVGSVAMLAGFGFYLVASKRPAPVPISDIPDTAINVAAAPAPVPAPAAVNLDRVVDVSDLDSLLDPPPIPVSEPRTETGPIITLVGYEEPASPSLRTGFVPFIPKSAPDEPLFTFWTGFYAGN